MTTMPPPKKAAKGLAWLLDTSALEWDFLRSSWNETDAVIGSGGSRTAPAAASCGVVSGFSAWTSTTIFSKAICELLPALSASRSGTTWSVTAMGSSQTVGTEPTTTQLTSAVASMKSLAALPQAGYTGQNDWIEIYFARSQGLDPTNHRYTLDLLDVAIEATMIVTFAIKEQANVPRPWQVDASVNPRVPYIWHSSWPAGHAAAAYVCSRVLAAVRGTNALGTARLDNLAARIAYNRQRAQVHTQLDCDVGQAVGQFIGDRLVAAATTQCSTYPVWASLYESARQEP